MEQEPIITEEQSMMTITLKDGTKVPVKAKTIYTKHSNGRVDCKIEIEKPINLGGQTKI